MIEVPELPLSTANVGGGEEATSTSAEDDGGKSGGDVRAEREEDGGATAKVSKFNLMRRCTVVRLFCKLLCVCLWELFALLSFALIQ